MAAHSVYHLICFGSVVAVSVVNTSTAVLLWLNRYGKREMCVFGFLCYFCAFLNFFCGRPLVSIERKVSVNCFGEGRSEEFEFGVRLLAASL